MTAVEVRVAGDARCPRCAGRLCLIASIGGRKEMDLCPACDAGNPHARKLIDYFGAHGSVQPQDMATVAEMLGHWLSSLDDGRPELTLAAQVEAWWRARGSVTAAATLAGASAPAPDRP